MASGRQLYYSLPIALMLVLLCEANQATIPTDSAYSITNLYENLLQREYPGPVAFPDHQVERKAQRSPSLRLRFGRRSDPEMMEPSAEKRWFGDVHQKPIRSPSLRLRFGRRNDPAMPLHSDFDILMNELSKSTDYNGLDLDEYDESVYERAVRAPRLRWGRSLATNQLDSEFNNAIHDRMVRSPLRLRFGRSGAANEITSDINEATHERIERSPLRLRFGRSAGGGEGNFPVPTIPPWILTAVAEPKNTPEVIDAATKN